MRLALLSSSTSVGTVAFLVAGEALQSYGQLHPSHCPGVSHGGEEKKETEQAGMHLADSLSVHEAPTRVPLPPHWGLGTGAGGGGTRVPPHPQHSFVQTQAYTAGIPGFWHKFRTIQVHVPKWS